MDEEGEYGAEEGEEDEGEMIEMDEEQLQ